MPVSFFTAGQRESYGCFTAPPSQDEIARFFHLSDNDLALIAKLRGDHNRLGFALQLTTVRFLGVFLENPVAVPGEVLRALIQQLDIADSECLQAYREARQHRTHAAEIRARYGYRDFSDPIAGFRLTRSLYALCWTGTDRLSVLFERATAWLLAHKVLLPGASVLERFIAKLRGRVEAHLWRLLGCDLSTAQRARLESLLSIPEGSGVSLLDQLRSSPFRISAPALSQAIGRLQSIRDFGIALPAAARVPPGRIASLARFATTAKVTAIARLPSARRIAVLVAFAHCMEATAYDDALSILEVFLHELFVGAMHADEKTRLRTLKDLDRAATMLADACRLLLDSTLPDDELRSLIFQQIRENASGVKVRDDAPQEVVTKSWQRYVFREDGSLDYQAYTFCVLDQLHIALRRRDVFVSPSWRYADPRAGLLAGAEWEAARPVICRTLDLPPEPQQALSALSEELDQTFREVAARLPDNPSVRFETVDGKRELILSPLDKLGEPPSLIALRNAVATRLPRVDLPEVLLEIAGRTGFTDAFTHLTERAARTADLSISLCAVLLAEACNTGPEPLLHHDTPALRRDRLSWVKQNYIRDESLIAANVKLVAAQDRVPLARAWGGARRVRARRGHGPHLRRTRKRGPALP